MAISEARTDCYDLFRQTDFRADVIAGLGADPKSVPSKYLYDSAGVKLFDLMCRQTEYYLPRAEHEIYEYFAPDIGKALGTSPLVIQLGRTSAESVASLLGNMDGPVGYAAIGWSGEVLRPDVEAVSSSSPLLQTASVTADLEEFPRLPESLEQLSQNRLVFCPGGMIGDLGPSEAREFLISLREFAGSEGKILIGVDLEKSADILKKAYSDKAQIADRFHLNLLQRANRELGADFDLMKFRYEAAYNAELSRMEMYVVSMAGQEVSIDGQRFSLANNERIRTQIAHKYSTDQFEAIVGEAGLKAVQLWLDSSKFFSAYLLEPYQP